MTLVLTTDAGPAGAIVDVLTPAQSTTRQHALELTTDIVANTSTLPGATLTAALNSISGLIAPANGYLTRHAYVNAASAEIGSDYGGVPCEAAVTFTTAAQLRALGNLFCVDVYPSGSSGGSGNANTNVTGNVAGGAGAGGPSHARAWFALAELIAALPIVITAPLGALGGASVQATGAGMVAGNPGVNGAAASFGTLCTAFPAGAGGRSNTNVNPTGPAGGGGGGLQGAGAGPDLGTGAGQAGGAPVTQVPSATNAFNCNPGYGGAQNGGSNFAGANSCWGGASGGSGRTNQGVGGQGGDSTFAGGGAAGAPNRNTLTAVPLNGSNGGVGNFPGNTTRALGGAGADGTGTQTASPGQNGARGVFPFPGDGGASGGDARTTSVAGTANGGAGGNGGFPGGAGAGGGPAMASVVATANSGPGGRSADACVVLTGYL